jgi:uncharacterized protein (TIGR02444 family)
MFTMNEKQSEAGLWHFALRFYARPGVEAALLRLQDEAGFDVPLGLALLYAGRRGIAVDARGLAALIAAAQLWQERVIGPLRRARRALAEPVPGTSDRERETLRTQVKAAELEAERILLTGLEQTLPERGSEATGIAIRANISAYRAMLQLQLSTQNEAALDFLVSEAASPSD